ncbi:DUF4350 domain-containing protein [Kineococcus sp. SYSU DK006]|uniref:DUF4350 domain-containing protein n=1 Tax=Kineococcus sp. SYSU DK006 TaxID=3383127 RepID=UPI003D7DD3B4
MSLLEVPVTAAQPPGTRRQRRRAGVLVGALVLAVLLLVALLSPRTNRESMSPSSVAPAGARALAQVLGEQGVRVREERSWAAVQDALGGAGAGAGEGATVLVTAPELLSADRLRALAASGADLVLLRPRAAALEALADGVGVGPTSAAADRDPGCAVPAAVAAGRARAGGTAYAVAPGAPALSCYGGSYVQVQPLEPGGGRLVVLGQPGLLTNRWVAQEGNAALALHVLGGREELVWYLPDPLDTESAPVPLGQLVPGWVAPATLLLLLAALTAALWRGRRLGRLVPEPLPVVVRAAETVEGHGRLYATAGAAGRAADLLRGAAVRRLRAVVRLDATAPVTDVADQVAWLTGRAPAQVRELLAGPAPRDDAALVRLAGDLDALERSVRGDSPRKAIQ